MPGTPPLHDEAYTKRHPDWRHSFHETRKTILDQMRADRESAKRIEVSKGEWSDSAGLTLPDLERAADRRARQVLEEAVIRDEDPIEAGRGLGAVG